jgi:protein ImuB
MLDITGCSHLFGGELEMGNHTITRLQDLRVTACVGIADTKGAARALAQFSTQPVSVAEAGQTSETLATLPVAALSLPLKMVADLARAGLTTIGQLQQQKSSELARRFGLELTKALGAASGHAPDPITPKAADPIYAARMTLPEPIGLVEDLEQVLERLARRVCLRLENDQAGARQFQLIVRCVDTGDHAINIGFARPCQDLAPVLRQFSHPLSKLEIEYGADWFRLVARQIEPLRPRQLSMGEDAKRVDHRLRLIETLGNRIGFDHVRIFQSQDVHVPELEFAQVEAFQGPTDWTPSPRLRPIRLFTPPEFVQVETAGRPPLAFKWRRMSFASHKVVGPERITPRWQSDKDLRTRDYWHVQTEQGRRLWLLNYPGDSSEDWYVAGEFP